jgi:hypothetical protein
MRYRAGKKAVRRPIWIGRRLTGSARRPGLAGWPVGLDPARIWLGLARSGLSRLFLFFFLCLVQILFLCCALNQFKNVLRLRKL